MCVFIEGILACIPCCCLLDAPSASATKPCALNCGDMLDPGIQRIQIFPVYVQVNLDRFDLFHAHLFLSKQHTLGLLFHAKEFPKETESFPVNLGYCQRSSELVVSQADMDWRNFLWHQVWLAVDLMCHSGTSDCRSPAPVRQSTDCMHNDPGYGIAANGTVQYKRMHAQRD